MLDNVARALLSLLEALAALVLRVLDWLEAVVGLAMTQAHIPPGLQALAGIVLAVLFLITALQLFGGFIRVAVIVVLLAVVVHALSHHGQPPPMLHHG